MTPLYVGEPGPGGTGVRAARLRQLLLRARPAAGARTLLACRRSGATRRRAGRRDLARLLAEPFRGRADRRRPDDSRERPRPDDRRRRPAGIPGHGAPAASSTSGCRPRWRRCCSTDRASSSSGASRGYTVTGLLAPGTTRAQAQADVDRRDATVVAATIPETNATHAGRSAAVLAVPARPAALAGDARSPFCRRSCCCCCWRCAATPRT